MSKELCVVSEIEVQKWADAASPEETVDEPETRQLFGQIYNVYNRETLYKEVWERPVSEVARKYDVSNVAMHKVCKSMHIPTPPLGYWAKLRSGKPVEKLPLPKGDYPEKKEGLRSGIATYKESQPEDSLAFLSDEDRSVLLSAAEQVLLPRANERLHKKIIAHRKIVSEWQQNHANEKLTRWEKRNRPEPPVLAGTVSADSLPRVCRIINALIKVMEPLGCSLTDNLDFVIYGEKVALTISEAKYDSVFNGKLTVLVDSKKSFRDCNSYSIEDKLGEIIILMYEAADYWQQERKSREEAERRRREEEKRRAVRRERYDLEARRTNSLVNAAEDYETACKIRAYIAAVKSSGGLDEKTAAWVQWAENKADWYDPTIAREDECFGKRKREQDSGAKTLKESYSALML